MPYITADGSIQTTEPWSVKKVAYIPIDIFWGIIHFVYVFFASICGVSQHDRMTTMIVCFFVRIEHDGC
jgi:hypothetical protein